MTTTRFFHLGFLALLAFITSYSWAQQMSIIPLNNAIAEQILPVIQSQLDEGSSATSYQNQIILNASAEETTKIKNLLQTLDSAGKQLLITVKNNNNTSNINGGSISNNGINNKGITVTKHGINTQTTTTRIEHHSIKNTGLGEQGLRVTEGYPSFISTGGAKIYTQPLMTSNGAVILNQEWKNAQTGFYATAWVNGNNVSISIEQEKQSFNNDSSMNNQQLQTRVSGQLGQWIAIGSINNQETISNRSLNSIEKRKASDNTMIYLKVELAE
jgi:hypothetical protein